MIVSKLVMRPLSFKVQLATVAPGMVMPLFMMLLVEYLLLLLIIVLTIVKVSAYPEEL